MKSSEETAQYFNQINEIDSQMQKDDFFETHSASKMSKMLEILEIAEEQLSVIYTEQEAKMEKLFDENGGGADNKEVFLLEGELTEINYYCEIARDCISELEEMLQEKDEVIEDEKESQEEVFEGLPNMRENSENEKEKTEEDFEGEAKGQTIEVSDDDVEKKFINEAKGIIASRDEEFVGENPMSTVHNGELKKKNLMRQIGKTMNTGMGKEKRPKIQEKERE